MPPSTSPPGKHTTTTPIRAFQLPNGGWWPYLDETSKLHSAAACCELFSPAHNSWYITCPWVWCVVYSCVEARDKSSSVPGDDVSTGYVHIRDAATVRFRELETPENKLRTRLRVQLAGNSPEKG